METKAEIIIEDGKVINVILKDVAGHKPLELNKSKAFKEFVETFSDQIVQRWVDYFIYHKSVKCIKVEGKIK
ncbi:hypothetical protein [Thiomicrorhabdus sp. Milos-T2]|uniref:hypothetical protein n=1 Tax=Thiomicrorhabdus sp. Milos-T2 TaxID=90814 RepID=UPI00068C04F1